MITIPLHKKYNMVCWTFKNFTELKTVITRFIMKVYNDNNGKVADYIPQLKNVDDSLFGVILVIMMDKL